MADTKAPPRRSSSAMFTFLTLGIAFIVIFVEPVRNATAFAAGFVLEPTIGFGGRLPLLTIFLASVVLVVVTTAIRHFLVDWTKMARMQEAMRAYTGEMREARKSNNTYKLKKLTDAQQDILQLQADVQTEQFKPMAFTMLLVVPIFAWLGAWLATLEPSRLIFEAPWNPTWNINEPYNWFGRTGWFPRWIVLYSLFGLPFGQIAQRVLKLWEYRHVDLDGDGKPAGEA